MLCIRQASCSELLQDNGAHIFFCGLKGMMPGIQEMLERVAKVRYI